MLNSQKLGLWALAVLALAASLDRAHAAEPVTIKSEGSHTLKRAPAQLKLSIELMGRGETLKAALSKLKEKQTSAQDIVQSLGAEMDSLSFDDPNTSSRSTELMEQMQQAIHRRVRNSGGPTPEGLKVPESFTVSSKLHVCWTLKAEDAIAKLDEVTQLVKKIKEADIAGVEGEELPLADQELMEEAEALGYDPYSQNDEVKPGTPLITFRTSISPQERQAALKAAFDVARSNAEDLAAAAGMKVTGLKSMEAGGTGMSASMPSYRYNGGFRSEPDIDDVETDPLQASSPKFDQIPFTYMISAQFNIEAADPASN